jgi:hypothetical protein
MDRRRKSLTAILFAAAIVLIIAKTPAICSEIAVSDGPVETVKLENKVAAPMKEGPDHTIVVYYFHTTNRCYSCTRIEKLTYLAIAEGFDQELGDGRIKFASINVEQDENKHFIKDYKLYTKSVIVSDVAQGQEHRWKNLQRVWELLREDQAFKEYVQEEVKLYLRGE